MKILFINKIDISGGAARMAWDLAGELRRQGHEVRFIVRRKFSGDNHVYQLTENNALLYLQRIFNRDFTVVLTNWRDRLLQNDIDRGAKEEILTHPWLKWADIVHCHNLHGNYFKLDTLIDISHRKPLLWTLHDMWAVSGHVNFPFYCQDLPPGDFCYSADKLVSKKREIYSLSNMHLVVPSIQLFNRINASQVLTDKEVSVISNGIDTTMFKPILYQADVRRFLKLPEGKKIILFFTFGQENREKGWGFIKKTIDSYITDRNIIFLGIGAKADNIAIHGKLFYRRYVTDRTLLAKYYQSADILLFPSLEESFGLVPVEAMACGLPVVAFPVGEIPDLITHKTDGYIAKYGDAEDYISGINYIFQHKTNISYTRIKSKYSLSTVAAAYLRLYEKIIH